MRISDWSSYVCSSDLTRISDWLNPRGYKYRGRKFHVSNIHAVLRNTAYVGVALYNKRDSKTGEQRPESEWVPIPVPPIITTDDFEAVQSRLVEQRPANQAARVTTTNTLLIGLTRCGRVNGCGEIGRAPGRGRVGR